MFIYDFKLGKYDIVKNFYIDENPDRVSVKDLTRLPKNKHTGYYNNEGWMSYRGRFIPYPRRYSDRVAFNKYKELEEKLKRHATSEIDDSSKKFFVVHGDVFYKSDRPNIDKYPETTITYYVDRLKWRKMSLQERWDYLRDLSEDGYSVPYEIKRQWDLEQLKLALNPHDITGEERDPKYSLKYTRHQIQNINHFYMHPQDFQYYSTDLNLDGYGLIFDDLEPSSRNKKRRKK